MQDDMRHRQELIKIKKRALRHLEKKAAQYGPLEVPIHLLGEIDALKEEIVKLEQELAGVQLQLKRPVAEESKIKPVAIIAASIVLVAVLVYVLVTSYPPVPVTVYIIGITATAMSGLADTPIPTTDTPVPSTATPVLTPNPPAPTDTPTATGTVTPVPSPTPTASLTTTPTDTATSTDTATPTPVLSTHTPTPFPLPDMVYVPAGEFIMGSDPRKDEYAQDDEQPVHTVYLDAFYVDKYEVINAQYRAGSRGMQPAAQH
jgi:hypothetical protein